MQMFKIADPNILQTRFRIQKSKKTINLIFTLIEI